MQVLRKSNVTFNKSIQTERQVVSSLKYLFKKKVEHDVYQGTCLLHLVLWVIIQSKRKSFVKRNVGYEAINAYLSTSE